MSDTGQGSIHAGEEDQGLQHERHRGHNQTEHGARRGVPFVGRGTKKFVPGVDVAMRRAYEQGQGAQRRLGEKNSHGVEMLKQL